MAGTEGPGPGLHSGTLQQMFGILITGARHSLRLGTKGPTGWHTGQGRRGRD